MELGRDSDTGGQVLLLLPFVASIFLTSSLPLISDCT